MSLEKKLRVPRQKLVAFCKKWKIRELSFFGSVLRDDFRPDSDVDALVSFSPKAHWGLMDAVDMQEELSKLLRREVDLLSRKGIERSKNWIRRKSILQSAQLYYVA